MRVLIINNGAHDPTLLIENFENDEITVRSYDALTDIRTSDFNCAVLSGSSMFPVAGNEAGALSREIQFIKNADIPILGICFGFELIISAFGGKLRRMSEKAQGVSEMRIKNPDVILQGVTHLFVYEGHRWVTESVPPELIVLAESEHGVEAVKHTERMIYGFQFHPEKLSRETEGGRILKNFKRIAGAA